MSLPSSPLANQAKKPSGSPHKRVVTLILLVLLLYLQYPLWVGKGGLFRVWELEEQVRNQQKTNDDLRSRNQQLEAEVANLRDGFDAIEEQARLELGMIKPGEVFVQIVKPKP